MKYLIASDIHGSLYYTQKLEKIIKDIKPDKIILLGDLYYHGPRNPLPRDYNPMQVSQILNNYKDLIKCTKGNCDAEVDEMISQFQFKEYIIEDLCGKKIMFTHGQKYNLENIPDNIDILIFGHFHTGYIRKVNNKVCINSGSISIPKNNTPNSYIVIENNIIILKDLNNKTIDSISII